MSDMWSGNLFAGARPGGLAGLDVILKTADEQMRTPRYRTDVWVRPGRVPAKRHGRKGTRRAWKRKHPPHYLWAFEEPTDVLRIGRTIIATPRQYHAIRQQLRAQP